jgi:hypothetical protein
MARSNRRDERDNGSEIGAMRAGHRREVLRMRGVPARVVRSLSKRTAGHLLSDLDN